jgi:hypothetical protein
MKKEAHHIIKQNIANFIMLWSNRISCVNILQAENVQVNDFIEFQEVDTDTHKFTKRVLCVKVDHIHSDIDGLMKNWSTVHFTIVQRIDKNGIVTDNQNDWANHVPDRIKDIVMLILRELDEACIEHPNYPLDNIYQAAIIAQQSGAVLQTCLNLKFSAKGKITVLQKELNKTASACIRMLIHLDTPTATQRWIKELDTQSFDYEQQ